MAAEQRILHPQWRDYYEPTPYPFGDWATLRHDSAAVFIPEGTFLDAAIYPLGSQARTRLARVDIDQQTIVLFVGDDEDTARCSGTVDIANAADEIPLTDRHGRPAGILVSSASRLAVFQTWPLGSYEFDYSQTGFAADVCLPVSTNSVQGFLLDDGSVLSGDVWLVGDDGVVLSLVELLPDEDSCEDATPVTAIRVDVVGDPLFRQRLCADSYTQPRFIKTVTFRRGCDTVVCSADSLGDVKMTAGRIGGESTILRIRNVNNVIRVSAVGEKLRDLHTLVRRREPKPSTGQLLVPATQVSGAGWISIAGGGNLQLAAPRTVGFIAVYNDNIVGSGEFTLPAVVTSGDGQSGVQGDGELALSAPESAGEGLFAGGGEFVGMGDLEASTVEAAGSGQTGEQGSGSLPLQAVQASGAGLISNTGSGALVVPGLEVAGDGVLGFGTHSDTITPIDFSEWQTWQCPEGVTAVIVELFGSGGGGHTGGGGGGGGYARFGLSTVPGRDYYVLVEPGQPPNQPFGWSATAIFEGYDADENFQSAAAYGGWAASNVFGGTGGYGFGDGTNYSGGSGADGAGGGGGGGAGSQGDGENASGSVGGAGGTGSGGAGGNTDENGNLFGGGGGGGSSAGAGAAGRVIIHYNLP